MDLTELVAIKDLNKRDLIINSKDYTTTVSNISDLLRLCGPKTNHRISLQNYIVKMYQSLEINTGSKPFETT